LVIASNKNIKGITIELNGDTTQLDRAIKDVVKESVKLQSELKEVENSLKFNPGNTELIAQKQGLLASQIEATTKKLDALKQAQSQVDAQFSSGKISGEQYRAFQREIINTESALSGLQTKLATTIQGQQQLETKTKQLQTLFAATGTDVDRFADTLGVGLVKAIKSGNASMKQLDTAIEKIGKASLGTSIDIDKLKVALKSADDGNSLKSIKKELSEVASEAKKAGNEVNSFGSELTSVIGGLAAGGGIAGVVSSALDVSSLNTKIDISFDVPEESKASIKAALLDIQAYGIDGVEALEGLRRQWALNKDTSDEANASLVQQAAVVASAYQGIDFIELIQETNEFAAALGITNEEALAMSNALLKAGFPPEQLDTMAEYGQQMKETGFSAKEIQAIFQAGIDTKTWNIDNLNDGVKEARIQMATFGQEVPAAVTPLLEQAGMAEETFQSWGKAVAEGGELGSLAMSQMVTWLDSIEDKALKNEIATKVFGTKWEDQGQNIISVFQGIGSAMDLTGENANTLNEQMNQINSDPAVQLKQAIADITIALTPLLTSIAEVVSKIAEWASNNPTLAATLTVIATVLGLVMAAVLALTPTILAMTGATAGFGVALNAAIWPVTLVVAAIAALIAIGVLLYKNWDEISAFCKTVFKSISDTIKSYLDAAKEIVRSVLDYFKNTFKNVLDFLKALVTGDFQGMKDAIKNQMENAKNLVSNILEAIKGFFKSILGDSYDTVVEKFTNIVSSVKEKMDNVKSTITDIWNNVMSFFKGINLFEIGKNIIEGLVNGIKNMATKAVNAAKEVASSVSDGIKNFFGIRSPSRLMMGFGENISEGLAIGIGDRIKEVSAMASKLSEAVSIHARTTIDPLQLRNNAAQSQENSEYVRSGDIIIQNMNVRNDNDIKLIAQELERLQRTRVRGQGFAY